VGRGYMSRRATRALFAIAVFAVALAGCSDVHAPSNGVPRAEDLGAGYEKPVLRTSEAKLTLFGGEDHKTYLGCLTCDPQRYKDALFNADGPYGQCPCSLLPDCPSLYCHGSMATFGGSGLFKDYSACSDNAQDPPVLVNDDGYYYGRFSVVKAFGHLDSVCAPLGRFANEPACKAVKFVCEYDTASACDDDCDSKYQSDTEDCDTQYGDNPEDADDLATCIDDYKDAHETCLTNCATHGD
jgi:hypothetical protein